MALSLSFGMRFKSNPLTMTPTFRPYNLLRTKQTLLNPAKPEASLQPSLKLSPSLCMALRRRHPSGFKLTLYRGSIRDLGGFRSMERTTRYRITAAAVASRQSH